MKNVAREKWIANFDMENLVGAILTNGTILSMALVIGALVIRLAEKTSFDFGPNIKAKSIPTLILTDFHRLGSAESLPQVLIHLSIAVLMLTPYVRILTSLGYFVFIERSRKHAMFAGFVFIVMTIILLTVLV